MSLLFYTFLFFWSILLDDYEDVDVLEETSPNSDLSFESRRRFKSEDLDDDINVEFTELTFCESQGASSTSSKIQTAALTWWLAATELWLLSKMWEWDEMSKVCMFKVYHMFGIGYDVDVNGTQSSRI